METEQEVTEEKLAAMPGSGEAVLEQPRKRKQQWDRKYYKYVKKPRGEWLARSGRPREANRKWACRVDTVNREWLAQYVSPYRLSWFVNASIGMGIAKLDPDRMHPLTGSTQVLAWKLAEVLHEWMELHLKLGDYAGFVNGCLGYTILSLGVRPEVGEIERLARLGRRPVITGVSKEEVAAVEVMPVGVRAPVERVELGAGEELEEVADLETVPEPGGQKQRIIKI